MRFLAEPGSIGTGVKVLHTYPAWTLVEALSAPAGVIETLDGETVQLFGRPVAVPEGRFPEELSPRYVIRFAGPVAPSWKTALADQGVAVHFWCPRFGACISLPAGLDIRGLGERCWFVVGAIPLAEEHCERRPAPASRGGLPPDLVDIVCFTHPDRVRIEAELPGLGATILATSSSKIRVRYTGAVSRLRDLVGVKLVEPARGHRLLSAPLAQAIGAASGAGEWLPGLDGEGEVVAVADSGLDAGTAGPSLHADFGGRVHQLISWPINDSWAEYVTQPGADDGGADRSTGHGTHVAGLAVGDGQRSGGRHRGVAPRAALVFQAMEQFTATKPAFAAQMPPGFYLSGRPLDLRELFEQARTFGARIHVNAWGDPAGGEYTNDSFEADHFLHEHPDALVLFAAGNDGVDRDGNRQSDARTLHAPGTAKNVVTVGATEGPLSGVGFRGTWGQMDPSSTRFRHPADRQDPVSGDPDRLAMFSSAGPTADNRIKPDLCAPGTNLCGPRSMVAAKPGWGLADPLPHYVFFGGTSMATGVAGGSAAVVRQVWRQSRGAAPSGVALKALLVLGVEPVKSRDGATTEGRTAAGFGRLSVTRSRPGDGVTLHDIDAGLETGDRREFWIDQLRSGPFRAVLCWYDTPGETLVNDVDLSLETADGQRVWGNHPAGQAGRPDRCNTVEMIDLPTLVPGRHRLVVTAANIPAGPQPLALAIWTPAARAGTAGIPIASLTRIGGAAVSAFAAAGRTYIDSVRGLDDAALCAAGRLSRARLVRLRRLLAALETARTEPLVAALPAEATWKAALGMPPGDVNASALTNGRAALAAAMAAVTRRWHTRLTIRDLRL